MAISAPGLASSSSPADRIDANLREAEATGRFSGVVLVSDRGQVIYEGAFGQASREYAQRNSAETQFNLASVNKSMTAIAVMRLVEAGRLQLDRSVDTWLGDRWLSRDIARRVTIRQLLSHTSGLGDYLEDAASTPCSTPLRVLADYRPFIARARLNAEPGTVSDYSNLGYLVLGALIEEVTGEAFDTHLRRTLLVPLDMARTQSVDLDYGYTRLAQGYVREPLVPLRGELSREEAEAHLARTGVRWRNNTHRCARPGTSAGGYYSTVGDLHRFARAIQSGVLVRAETLAEMRRAQNADNPNYGLGFTTRGGHIGHSGEITGAEARYRILPDGHIVIVLSNVQGGVGVAWDRIEAALGAASRQTSADVR
ncbi:serine hydrolase domain-containing protein [Sphingosinicella terrae]|uniref:serine hydrolase domain-containing protein n=1 Tax=Sphingosinicella terrae TaxID=2172047 RepID=UPI0013B4668E|nr:serine hydrolase domain-containing protein [Sphingosinicella terrae]